MKTFIDLGATPVGWDFPDWPGRHYCPLVYRLFPTVHDPATCEYCQARATERQVAVHGNPFTRPMGPR